MAPQDLQDVLEWASARLLALPSQKVKPSDTKVIWPEYDQDKWEIIEFRERIALRCLAPDKDEIPLMEQALSLPNFLPNPEWRRLIRKRCLVNPLSNTHIYTWMDLGVLFSMKRFSIRARYKKELSRLALLIPQDKRGLVSQILTLTH